MPQFIFPERQRWEVMIVIETFSDLHTPDLCSWQRTIIPYPPSLLSPLSAFQSHSEDEQVLRLTTDRLPADVGIKNEKTAALNVRSVFRLSRGHWSKSRESKLRLHTWSQLHSVLTDIFLLTRKTSCLVRMLIVVSVLLLRGLWLMWKTSGDCQVNWNVC